MSLMAWAGNLLGSSNIIDKLVDEAVNSDSEKARGLATERLKALAPFKVVQRIMVSAVMAVWVPTALLLVVFASLKMNTNLEWLLTVIKEPFIYYPTGAAFTAYLGGGTISEFRKK